MATYLHSKTDIILEVTDDNAIDTVNLLAAKNYPIGRYYWVKNRRASSSVTINCDGSELFDDDSGSYVLTTENEVLGFYSAITGFRILSTYSAGVGGGGGSFSITTSTYTATSEYEYLLRDLDLYGGLTLNLPDGSAFELAELSISAVGRGGRISVFPSGNQTVNGKSRDYIHAGETFTLKFYNNNWRLI